MKHYEIDPDSLHYRLASFYADYNEHYHRDVCSYWRKVVRGFFNILFGLFALFLVGGSLIHFGLGVIFAIFTGAPWEATWQMGIVLIAILLAVIFIVGGLILMLFSWLTSLAIGSVKTAVRKAAAKDQPPFIITAYRSIKEKTCIPVKVVHKSK